MLSNIFCAMYDIVEVEDSRELAENVTLVQAVDGETGKLNFVLKKGESADAAKAEAERMRALAAKGVAVAAVAHIEKDVVITRFLPGKNGEEMIQASLKGEGVSADEFAERIANWLDSFYAADMGARGDMDIRNFIFAGDKVFAVDFDETADTAQAEEKQQLIDSVALYDTEGDIVNALKQKLA